MLHIARVVPTAAGPPTAAVLPASSGPTPRFLSRTFSRTWSKLELPSISLSSRYSVAKFVALQDYIAHATPWRTAWVLLSTPLPGLAAALLPAFLPLHSPREGPTWGFYIHAWFIVFIVSAGNMVSWTAITQIPKRAYSTQNAIVVGLCCATLQMGGAELLWRFVGFSVPFMWITGFGLWTTNLCLANAIVLRSKCVRDRALWTA